MASLFDLSGKTALCSGGAKGIGAAMAIGLAQAGCDIVLLQRDPNAKTTQSEIRGLGRQCDIVECDVSNRSTTTNVVRTVLETRQVDILLNAAGTQRRFPAEEMTDEALDDVLNTNLTGLFTVCRTVGAHWLTQGQKGVIINVASLAAMQGGINMSAYAASKGGVLQLTKALSNEWAGRGIRVNCVSQDILRRTSTRIQGRIRTSKQTLILSPVVYRWVTGARRRILQAWACFYQVVHQILSLARTLSLMGDSWLASAMHRTVGTESSLLDLV